MLLSTFSTSLCAQNDESKYTVELLQAGTAAPDFSLTGPNGEIVKLSNFKGRYIVLDFWASWCPDCRRDAPNVVKAYDQFKDKRVTFIGISFDTDKTSWTKAIEKYDMKYYQVSELKKWKETKISTLYNIKWIPTLYLISPEGKVTFTTIEATKMIQKLEEIFSINK